MDSVFKQNALKSHAETLLKRHEETPYTVFLCGPTIQELEKAVPDPEKLKKYGPPAYLRKQLKDELESTGFDVVLGEDDGLEDARLQIGLNAQDNELEFIVQQCDAVVLVAGSVGSFCELGLFSWHFTHSKGAIKNTEADKDFILIVDKQFEGDRSYFNEGPAEVVSSFGQTIYADFNDFDINKLIRRLRTRKSLVGKDGRGKPRKQP